MLQKCLTTSCVHSKRNRWIETDTDFYAIPTEEGSLLLEMGSYAGVPETIDAKFEEMLASFKLQ